MDIVASLYNRNSLSDIVRRHRRATCSSRSRSAAACARLTTSRQALRCGRRQGRDQHRRGGAAGTDQRGRARASARNAWCSSIEAKRAGDGRWEAYTDNGREHTGLDVVEWARRAVDLGAGEILLTSVDQEGTRKGFDIELTRAVADAVAVPVIASGGMGTLEHLVEVVHDGPCRRRRDGRRAALQAPVACPTSARAREQAGIAVRASSDEAACARRRLRRRQSAQRLPRLRSLRRRRSS